MRPGSVHHVTCGMSPECYIYGIGIHGPSVRLSAIGRCLQRGQTSSTVSLSWLEEWWHSILNFIRFSWWSTWLSSIECIVSSECKSALCILESSIRYITSPNNAVYPGRCVSSRNGIRISVNLGSSGCIFLQVGCIREYALDSRTSVFLLTECNASSISHLVCRVSESRSPY